MKRKSNAQKRVEGTYREDRDRTTAQFAATSGAKAPSYVRQNKLAHAEWKRVVPILEAEEILRETDLSLLASYCILFARWREAAQKVEELGQVITVTSTTRTGRTEKPVISPWIKSEIAYQAAMMRVAVKYGFSPADRERLTSSSPVEGPDELEEFIKAG